MLVLGAEIILMQEAVIAEGIFKYISGDDKVMMLLIEAKAFILSGGINSKREMM